jgi:translation initiation factor IF-2
MPKMRVHEIAKKLNLNSKDIIETLKGFDISVKNHMTSINEEYVNTVIEYYTGKDASEPIDEDFKVERDMKLIKITHKITVKEFSEKLERPTAEIIKKLMSIGIMANINQDIDFNTASEIADGYEVTLEIEEEVDILEKEFFEEEKEDDELKQERPPVVVVMGHVDHGKTSLLDYIRNSKVTKTEAGGITQHIGAYTVDVSGKPITFLDTPGHEAFTAMRMRGAKVTDIAILVVAADDGIMPQTAEAISHAKAAEIEIIVAINKIDKPGANIDKVKQELVEFGLQSEDWGGTTICVPVSALTGKGVDDLLEMITLSAELKELKANKNKAARGTVIEASLDKARGSVSTLLVQEGTLKIGDSIVVGTSYGKVRAMMDDKGKKLKDAGPSTPVEILGMSEVPIAGDMFYVAKGDKHARQLAQSVVAKTRKDMIKVALQKVSLDDLFDQIQLGNIKDLNIIIKADVQGSVEAVKTSIEKLSNEEVRVRVIHGGVGAITETDIMLASASNAIVICFNVRAQPSAKSIAEAEKVDVRFYSVIYNAIEDINSAMKGLLDPIFEEKVIGHAEIRQIFKASGVGTIGGCYVTDGKITRNSQVRILRDNIVSYDGTIEALKRFKDDAKEVAKGFECGMSFTKFNDIKENDIIEAYIMEEIKR